MSAKENPKTLKRVGKNEIPKQDESYDFYQTLENQSKA